MVSTRTLLLLSILAGCAHATSTGEGDVEDAPEPSGKVLTADDIERAPGTPIEVILMRRFPGVHVERAPNGGIVVRIRGRTSIRGSNKPLYVIDGVPIEPGPGGALFGINPYDIESIEVLTDPASTTMYGIRGANGVIVIKTKEAARPGQ